MLKKDITYEDFNGETRTETFWFHLTTAELMEMQVSKKEGFKDWIEKIIATDNREVLIAQFKKLILSSVGRRSEDGSRFFKTDEIRDDFAATNAFGALFMELVTDEKASIAFVQKLIPANFAEEVKKLEGALPTPEALDAAPDEPSEPTDEQLSWQDYTEQQLFDMSEVEFRAIAGMKPAEMPRPLLVIAMRRKNERP